MSTYRELDPEFVDKFLSSIYVDDLVTGSGDVELAYEFYAKSKLCLAEAGFKLRSLLQIPLTCSAASGKTSSRLITGEVKTPSPLTTNRMQEVRWV